MLAHLSYLSYVARHKWWVLVAGLRVGAPLWRLIVHDWTKFLPSEWLPYVRHFYGADDDPEGFDRAWNFHQKRNAHHWQFWLLTRDSGESVPVDMPEGAMREMVADWAGAGRAIKGRWEVCRWYGGESRKRMVLAEHTRNRVEALLTQHFGPIPVIHTLRYPIRG